MDRRARSALPPHRGVHAVDRDLPARADRYRAADRAPPARPPPRRDELVPGYGTLAAVTAGLCTLLFPFATLFFDHALSPRSASARSPCCGTRETACVWSPPPDWSPGWRSRRSTRSRSSRPHSGSTRCRSPAESAGSPPTAAGWRWDCSRSSSTTGSRSARRSTSPTRTRSSAGGSAAMMFSAWTSAGFFGVTTPERGVAFQLLFGYIGIVTISPIVIAGVVGLIPLWRAGWRREAALVAALAAAYLVYNSGYDVPFGGGTPGPRFLIRSCPSWRSASPRPIARGHGRRLPLRCRQRC